MSQFKLREPLLWIHEVRGRGGKETLREVVLFVAGDEHWSTVEDPRTREAAGGANEQPAEISANVGRCALIFLFFLGSLTPQEMNGACQTAARPSAEAVAAL